MPKIKIEGLKKSFGSNDVLRGVDLEVSDGQSLVIIGGSGTGKSVLLKCILGLMQPDAGKIFIDGKDVTQMSANQRAKSTRQIGMLFQGAALFDSLKIWENVAFRLIYGEGGKSTHARNQAIECLRQVGLGANIADMRPAELSGGMQKRVGLARAIAAEPSILFFDEPTTGLDPIMADVINNLIVDRVKALGCSAVSITHDMISAEKIADDIAMLFEGKIIWQGPATNIQHSGNEMVDQFVNGRADGPIQMSLEANR